MQIFAAILRSTKSFSKFVLPCTALASAVSAQSPAPSRADLARWSREAGSVDSKRREIGSAIRSAVRGRRGDGIVPLARKLQKTEAVPERIAHERNATPGMGLQLALDDRSGILRSLDCRFSPPFPPACSQGFPPGLGAA